MTNLVLDCRNIGNAPKIKPILNKQYCSVFKFQSLFISSSVNITIIIIVQLILAWKRFWSAFMAVRRKMSDVCGGFWKYGLMQ